ncbi:Ger(x)C family spore germination protein [Neobacillus sp. NRS-1170]|uniref:Ger(x)C family spore germination protein n=1 Tax=Neobacillus sp. NRS-1170 TaxID=3233898 RepID=UPI003D2D55F4
MRRITAVLVTMFFLLNLTTGCGSKRELNELAIISAIGIDEQNGEFLVSFQVVDPGEVSAQKSGASPVTLFKEKGKTVAEAIRRVTVKAPRLAYAAHLQMLVISEKVASKGISRVLDVFFRPPDFRSDFLIVVTKGIKAQQLLKLTTPIDKIPSGNMFKSLTSSERVWGPLTTVKIQQLISELVSEGKNPILTGITVTNKTKKEKLEKANELANIQQIDRSSRFRYVGLAVFKKDKLIGWLNEEESSGYNYVIGKVFQTGEVITCPNKKGNILITITKTKSKIKSFIEKGKPKMQIQIRAKARISEIACTGIDLSKPKMISMLEKQTNHKIKHHVERAIQTVQRKYKSDIFGFGANINGHHPKAWHTLKKDWDQTFAQLPVNVNVQVTIQRSGKYGKSFIDDIK